MINVLSIFSDWLKDYYYILICLLCGGAMQAQKIKNKDRYRGTERTEFPMPGR